MSDNAKSNKPTKLSRQGDGLQIEWADGVTTFVTWLHLRKMCPCASCNGERSKPPDPFKMLSAREVAAGAPQPMAMYPKGHYAYQIAWNDGHDTGIYSLELLRELSST